MKNLLTICTFTITCLINAQNFTITKSEIFEDKKKNSELNFAVGGENDELVTIRAIKSSMGKIKSYTIQSFDKNLNLVSEFEYDQDDTTIQNAFIKDNKLHILEMLTNMKDRTITMTVSSSELNALKFTKTNLFTYSGEFIKTFGGFGLGPIFFHNLDQMDSDYLGQVVFSKNENFFVVNFDVKDKKNDTHKIFVFNSNFEKIFDHEIVNTQKDKHYKFNDVTVDDRDGTVYFLGRAQENNSKQNKRDGKANYHFELLKINANGEKRSSFKDPEKFIGSLSLWQSENNISCVGFYGNEDQKDFNGVCVYTLDATTLDIKNKKFNPFSDEFLSDKFGDKDRKKDKASEKGVYNFKFKNGFFMANGDLYLDAEEQYITYRTYMSNGNMRQIPVFNFDDILAIKIDADGNLIWSRNINKKQSGLESSSYTSIVAENAMHFFVNSSDEAKQLKDDRIEFRPGLNLNVVTVAKDGVFTYKQIVDEEDSKLFYRVNNGVINLDTKTVILVGDKRKDAQIMKIKVTQ